MKTNAQSILVTFLTVMLLQAQESRGGVRYDVVGVGGTGYGLNNNGIVVGSVSTNAFYWTPETGRVVIGSTLYDNRAMDINDSNILVAFNTYTYDYGRQRNYSSYAYDVDLGEVVTSEVRMTQDVRSINNKGNTAGQNKLGDYPNGSHFTGASYHVTGINQNSLITWGDGNGVYDINDRSVAVGKGGKVRTPAGWIILPGSGTTHAYGINDAWNGGNAAGRICGSANGFPAYWDGSGNLHVVNPVEVTVGVFRKVNDHGQMVGQVTYNGVRQGALYQNGQLILLNDVVTSGSTIDAMDINDHGQILANSAGSAVLLNPVYFADGQFSDTSLESDWQQSGSGSASMLDEGDGNYCMVLTAGSSVTVTQLISTPTAGFRLSIDYQFLTVDPAATLNLELNGTLVDSITAPPTLEGSFLTHEIPIDDASLLGLGDVALSFTYDGLTGTQVLIDNVIIQQDNGMDITEPLSGGDLRVTSVSVTAGGTQLQLTWASDPTATYAIEGSPDLTASSWSEVVGGILSQGSSTTYPVPITSGQHRFFRVITQP